MGDRIHLHHLRPVDEQIVVIEHVLPLLGLDIGAKQRLELILPPNTPGKIVCEDLIKLSFGVDGSRIDRKASVESALRFSTIRDRAEGGSSGRQNLRGHGW